MPYKFRGGVHPDYMKAPEEPVVVITPPPQVVIPMAQHIGAPCQPIVKVGDYVTMGQKIGDNPAPVSAPVHSPVSGKVIAIEPRPHPLGDMIPAIVIENDYQDTPCTDLAPMTEEQLKDPEAILARLREAGIVGMGGAMFPTAFKIRGGLGKVDTLIINGAECEPYLNGDHWTMKLHPEELLKGIELARIASGLDKAYYGIEKNKMDAIELLNSKNPAQYGVEIVPEEVKYPQGAEKMQIKAITNREILLAANDIALTGLWFCGAKYFAAGLETEREEKLTPALKEALRWLDEYFSGSEPDFMPHIELHGSDFRRRVWTELMKIPYGATVTYGELAKKLEVKSAQAVGGAVGHNPISIIVPCHRVLGADGSLTGYAGGVDKKARLLELESGGKRNV